MMSAWLWATTAYACPECGAASAADDEGNCLCVCGHAFARADAQPWKALNNAGFLPANTEIAVSAAVDRKLKEVGELCENCRLRESTGKYVGTGGSLALVHGFYQVWCDHCMLRAQLQYARDEAERIPELEAALLALDPKQRG